MKNQIQKIRNALWLFVLVCSSAPHGYAQYDTINSYDALPYSTPEAEGVASAGILNFLDAVDEGKNELHSFVILRHGKIISEGWWSPYAKDLKHIMYSVSKSFTSMGVGLAIAENRLKLTDKIASFFPQSLPDSMTLYMKEMTVQDLLKMSTGMNTDPLFNVRNSTDWPKAFLSSPVENKPGDEFKYNNMATFMLSAIVQKATGEKLVDYMNIRLFKPLGIVNFTWDETPEGYTFGAIGLKLLSNDMAKFGQLLLQKGKWDGKQIVPESWVEEATSFQIMSNDPSNEKSKELNDWAQGYGYQFWICRNNAFRADGLGGQFIIVLPEKDAVVVLTSSATDTQEELNLVWDYLLPAMQDAPLPEDRKAAAELAGRIASLSTLKTSSSSPATMSTRISGNKIGVAQNELGIQAMRLTMSDTDARVQLEYGSENYEFTAGLDHWKSGQTTLKTLASAPEPGQVLPVKVAAKHSWIDESTLELTIKFVEESIRSEVWILRFEENGPEIKVPIEIKNQVEFVGIKSRMLEGILVK